MESVIEQCSNKHFDYNAILEHDIESRQNRHFKHHKLPVENGIKLLESVPMTDVLRINDERVSLFVSRGGCIYRPHKDGLNIRCGINYNVHIEDDLCVTGWYDEQDMANYPTDTLGGRSREAYGFDRNKHKPIKTMTARQGECVLFNTDIYHDWDNSRSQNIRVLLTLRFKAQGSIYFSDARQALFGY
jgi:hypothetical protein